jgi:hypothetical protein
MTTLQSGWSLDYKACLHVHGVAYIATTLPTLSVRFGLVNFAMTITSIDNMPTEDKWGGLSPRPPSHVSNTHLTLTDHLRHCAIGYPNGTASFQVKLDGLTAMQGSIPAGAKVFIDGPGPGGAQAFLCVTRSDKGDGTSACSVWTGYCAMPTNRNVAFRWATKEIDFKVETSSGERPTLNSAIDEVLKRTLEKDDDFPMWNIQEQWFQAIQADTESWIDKHCRSFFVENSAPSIVITGTNEASH